MKVASVILAAGYGKRMRSTLPKVMHRLAGRPLVDWAVRAVTGLADLPPVVVVGHGKAEVTHFLQGRAQFVEQKELLGTGHAVMQAETLLDGQADLVLVTYADMPLLRAETLQTLVDLFRCSTHSSTAQAMPAIAMLTVERDDSQGFGRIVRDTRGAVQAIVEEADCTPEQKQIRELNPGVYCFDAAWLWRNLDKIPLSKKGEYYLTDMVGIAVGQGRSVVTRQANFDEVNGINTRIHLAHAEAVMRQRILENLMLNGVTLIDPTSTYIDDTVEIGSDTVVLPGCIVRGATTIGANCEIGPHSYIRDCRIGDGCRLTYSYLEEAQLDNRVEMGPFARLRKGAHLGDGVHMGNFGEIKNSYLAPGVKMGHFSYLGDAHIEENVNIGAGTITCNYDGKKKSKTRIGKNAFIGSDTLLVAPVEIGEGATTGAGAVVTRDVAPHALVYGVPARSAQNAPENPAKNQPQTSKEESR
jgi:bifunctional UDP-N-acetylglucosamine pyrophosphorylase/glucosamine-1-phosphate N-acetyltransferase